MNVGDLSSDPPLIRGPDVKTLIELQRLNELKRRKLAGT